MAKTKFLILVIFLSLASLSAQAKDRNREEWSLIIDGYSTIGSSDRNQIYFPSVNPAGLTTSTLGSRLGIKGVSKSGFGLQLLTGYKRLLYTSVGSNPIRKNFFTIDLAGLYHPLKQVKRWDPYMLLGTTVWIGSATEQGFLSFGTGTHYFLSDHWSLKGELSGHTEFRGLSGQLALGIGYHF